MRTPLKLFDALLVVFILFEILPYVVTTPPAFLPHLVLVACVLPLSFAAMAFFVSVLARRRIDFGQTGWLLPAMLAAGIVLSAGFLGKFSLTVMAFAIAAVSAGVWHASRLILKIGQEAAQPSHPGLDWYHAALIFLGAGLVGAFAVPFFPMWQEPLLMLHERLSLYGFLGLGAICSLQVLMSAVASRPDPFLIRRLGEDLPLAASGVILIAAGALLHPAIHLLGLACFGWPLARIAWAWWRLYRQEIFALHGIAPVLAATLLGFAAALAGTAARTGPLAVFVPGFLFPLVTGAAAYLIPIWRLASARPTAQRINRHRLNRWGGLRALLFSLAAVAPFAGIGSASFYGLMGLVWFSAAFIRWSLSAESGV